MKKLLILTMAALLVAGFAFAGGKQEAAAPTVLKAAFIGGANYEELYKEIPKWEAKTGMKVEVVFKGDSRALSDIKILAGVNYGEDSMGKGVPLPAELKYLR